MNNIILDVAKISNSSIYVAFEDHLKEMLSILGYENLFFHKSRNNGESITYFEKTELLRVMVIEEICHLANVIEYNESLVFDGRFQTCFFEVLNNFLLIYGKYFYFNKPLEEVFQIYKHIMTGYYVDFFSGNINLFEKIYETLESFIDKPKSMIIKNRKPHVCEYCGSRYNYNTESNCPSCGA